MCPVETQENTRTHAHTHTHTHTQIEAMAHALAGPTILFIKAVPVKKLTELKIKSGIFEMINFLS